MFHKQFLAFFETKSLNKFRQPSPLSICISKEIRASPDNRKCEIAPLSLSSVARDHNC